MPAYSQSTIRRRSPSSRKFAFRRSLWHGTGAAPPRRLSMRPAISCARSYASGIAPPRCERCLAVGLDDPEGVERPGNRRPVVERAQRRCDTLEHRRVAHVLERRCRARDEARDEPALGLHELDDLGPDPAFGRGPRCSELDAPVDPQKIGVPTGNPEHEDLSVDLDLRVVVRDASAEHLEASATAGPDALDGVAELGHARIRSPAGS